MRVLIVRALITRVQSAIIPVWNIITSLISSLINLVYLTIKARHNPTAPLKAL